MEAECRRVLVAAAPPEMDRLLEMFFDLSLQDWEAVTAGTPEQAQFTLQHDSCHAVLLDESLVYQDDLHAVAKSAGQCDTPVILLAEPTLEMIAYTTEQGIHQLLPRDLALEQPALVAIALNQAVRWASLQRRDVSVRAALAESRRHIDRLMGMLWEESPLESCSRWLTQRRMLERLREEIARSHRYHVPLSLAVGEVQAGSLSEWPPDACYPLTTWTAEQVCRAKRISDVAGQYGSDRFLLLMVQTTEFGALKCCQRLKQTLETEVEPPAGMTGPVTVHLGVASYSETTARSHELIECAEQRLEEAKAMDGDRVAC